MSFLQTEFFILSVKYGKDSFNFMVQKLKVEINFCCDVLKEFTNINYDPRQKKKKKVKDFVLFATGFHNIKHDKISIFKQNILLEKAAK